MTSDDVIERYRQCAEQSWNQHLELKEFGDALASELAAARERIAAIETLCAEWEQRNPALDWGNAQVRAAELRAALGEKK
jgi:hypothetical protein